MTITKLEKILKQNKDLMTILKIINSLELKDSWLCAGTIRNFIWNYLSGTNTIERSSDIDVIFHDYALSYEETVEIESKLQKKYPQYNWELKNQVYMHVHSPNTDPYLSSCDAISKFPEKCTAIGARLNKMNSKIEIFAPYGINDMLNYIVAPTPHYLKDYQRLKVYHERVQKKNWKNKWPNLKYYIIDA